MSESIYDYSKLKGKIREVFGTQGAFAMALGLSETSVSNKLNNIVDWKQEEMEKSVDLLGVSFSEIHVYFFTKKLRKTQQTK